MKVILTVQHPAHVHFFRHAIAALEGDGAEVWVFTRENEMTVDLLDHYDIDHRVLAREATSLGSLAATQATMETRLFRAARQIKPDVMVAVGGVAVSHVAAVIGARSIVFTDTEHATIVNRLTWPFADAVCTPTCFRTDVGTKQIRYRGFHELAYLHPDRFSPDPDIRNHIDVNPADPLVVFRISSWNSSHDVGQSGFTDLTDAVTHLESAGATVVVTSEVPLPPTLQGRRSRVPPHRIHDLLSTADLFVGEGATMAAESAVLGTPAVYVNSLSMGYTEELEEHYGLFFGFHGEGRHEAGLEKATMLLERDRTRDWERRREQLLSEKQDTTDVILRIVRALGLSNMEPDDIVADRERTLRTRSSQELTSR